MDDFAHELRPLGMSRRRRDITDDELRRIAPSVFGDRPHRSRSPRYAMVPTVHVLRAMRQAGWVLVHAAQTRSRTWERARTAKHALRFRRSVDEARLDELTPEVVVLNSHDGSRAYQVRAGIFRLVCLNGMVVGDSVLPAIKVHHRSNAIEDVPAAAETVVKSIPTVIDNIESWKAHVLDDRSRERFANRALALRWEPGEAPIAANDLLDWRRVEDTGRDLWTTLNVVQEHMMRGGISGKSQSGRKVRTRPIKNVAAEMRVNAALWDLASEFAGRVH